MRNRGPRIPALLLTLTLAACSVDLGGSGDETEPNPGSGGAGAGGLDATGTALVDSDERGGEDLELGSLLLDACPAWTAGESVHGLAHPEGNTLASATYARDMLLHGLAPNPERVRPQEFVNFYEAPYVAKDAVQLFADLVPATLDVNATTTRYTLQIALAAPPRELPKLSLTFVLDGSGSMVGEALARQTAAVEAIASQLRDGDQVRVFTFADEVFETLTLREVSGPDDQDLLDAVPHAPAGDSKVTPALHEAFTAAMNDVDVDGDGRTHRVILMTDGAARLDDQTGDGVRSLVRAADQTGVYVTAVSTGPTTGYDDSLLRAVSLDGRGSTVYLDDDPSAEVGDLFRTRFGELMGVAARDVTFELELPAGTRLIVSPETQGESGSGVRTAHLAQGDALVMQHEVELCSVDAASVLDDIVVRASWLSPEDSSRQGDEVVVVVSEASTAEALARVSKISALTVYADALRGPVPARLAAAAQNIDAALMLSPGDDDLQEVLSLLSNHPALTVAE